MFSLRSISLFALAFTALTSAAPTVNVARDETSAVSGLLGVVNGGNGGLTTSTLPGRGEVHKSFPEIFKGAHTDLGPIIADLEADIKVVAEIDVDVVVKHLGEVVILLDGVLADVSVVVKTDGYLVADGVKLTVDVVAKIIFDVLVAVFVILQAVIKVVLDVRVGPIVVEIGAKLVAILKAVVIIDVGLKASLAVLVKAVVEAIAVLKFDAILVVLGVKA